MTLDELKTEAFKDPDVKREYDAMEPEFQLIQAIIDRHRAQNLTQTELASKTGIDRTDISRLENGNPSLKH